MADILTNEILLQNEQATQHLDLAETITTLQHQLQTSLQLASQFKSENVVLQSQLQDAQQLHAAMSSRYNEWREAWKKDLEGVVQREQTLEREKEKWNARLNDKRVELEELERKCWRDGDSGSGCVDVPMGSSMKEMENNYAIKIQKLTQEVCRLIDCTCILPEFDFTLCVNHPNFVISI